MNWLNHYIFAVSMCLLFLETNLYNLLFILLFSLVFGTMMDIDHALNKKAPWYHKKMWIQEPLSLVLIGLPIAVVLSFVDKMFFVLVLVPYASHIFLDYLCVSEAHPLAPFSKIKKKEGLGIFIADDLFRKTQNSKDWARRAKAKGMKAVSENYFTLFNVLLLVAVVIFKFNAY